MLSWCLIADLPDPSAAGIWRSCVRITKNLSNGMLLFLQSVRMAPKLSNGSGRVKKCHLSGFQMLEITTAKQYFQEFNLLKFGWVPALFVVDKNGVIRFAHYGEFHVGYP